MGQKKEGFVYSICEDAPERTGRKVLIIASVIFIVFFIIGIFFNLSRNNSNFAFTRPFFESLIVFFLACGMFSFFCVLIYSFLTISRASFEVIADLLLSSNAEREVNKKPKRAVNNSCPQELLFFAALFAPANIRDNVLGDMVERYKKDLKLFGKRRAYLLMTVDICRSNYLWIKEAIKGKLLWALKWAGILELIKRIIN